MWQEAKTYQKRQIGGHVIIKSPTSQAIGRSRRAAANGHGKGEPLLPDHVGIGSGGEHTLGDIRSDVSALRNTPPDLTKHGWVEPEGSYCLLEARDPSNPVHPPSQQELADRYAEVRQRMARGGMASGRWTG